MFREGKLNDREVEISIPIKFSPIQVMSNNPNEDIDNNVSDMLSNFFPNKEKKRKVKIKEAYKIFVDIFTILVLTGVSYFLLRRFLTNDSKLEINPPVILSDSARVGMKKDSLLVGSFILLHVGARLFSAIEKINSITHFLLFF